MAGGQTDLEASAEHAAIQSEMFLEAWISGRIERSHGVGRFGEVLAPGFHIVGPSGELLSRRELLDYLVEQHGTDPGTRRWVENPRTWSVGDALAVVLFDERQVRDAQELASRVSILCEAAPSAPDGVRWLHVHESRIAV